MNEADDNLVENARILVRKVDVARADGGGNTDLVLSRPVEIGSSSVHAVTICRMCMVRLPIRATEKVILSFFLDMEEVDGLRRYSYEELGEVIGKGARAAEVAVATLRRAGLLLTTRIGRTDAKIAFSCRAFIDWAEDLRSRAGLSEPVVEAPAAAPEIMMLSAVPPALSLVPQAEQPAAEQPAPKPRRRKAPAAKKERAVSPEVAPAETAQQPAEPQEEVTAEHDADGNVDGTAERSGTLRAAGRAGAQESDDDDISFGSETADTDMGQGVRVNPDL